MAEELRERARLKRSVSSLGLFSIAFGSMIGVGWVTAMGSWLLNAGPAGAVLAFVAGGFIILSIGFCYAEVTALLPVAGGEVAYAYKSFGVGKSFVVGWFLSFGYLSVSAFEAISVGKVLSYLFPAIDVWPLYQLAGETVYGSHLLLALAFTLTITAINYFGVQSASRFQIYLTVLFIACAIIFIFAAFIKGNLQNIAPAFGSETASPAAGVLAVLVTVPFWFVGFDTIPQSAEEADQKVSFKKLGILIIISIIGAIGFYILVILATSMLGNRTQILQADLPTADAFELALQMPIFTKLILVAALVGLLTSWNGFFLAGSRVLFALGRGKVIFERLGETHKKYKTPHFAVLFSGIITMLAAFIGRGAMLSFVNVGSFCIALAFAGVSLSFLKLKISDSSPRPYRAPGGKIMGYLALAGSLFILIVMVLPGSPAALSWPLEWLILIFLTFLGLAFWNISAATRLKTSRKDRDFLILEKSDHAELP